ncbi:hypothetical protein [Bartonella krasnovii]|uniref:Uncharacterized protein n=1 Tax=Bartonella krasnovii TaxID=2267275 RepID=A0A5B9D118_9HYPH|nr:hypothetical protein [Bartonella krasnovii]QEE11909.1 hypothetical protein D1092_02550 [Bartonella krasnovii]QEE12306.1 hypothetical protein D1092_04730 [Bartonella krasnovii]UNF29757.1 hypothetical protein MNL13_03090 [Bartonella krasnovii]UNF36117.1 hypothetical protein MNL12_03085 [Bartonella krasnovii]UNF37772.1 hypothetical protein MNL11_03295 [Bartonella krasnovii]
MYSYEIKPTWCVQTVVKSAQNLGELCITISGYKDDPYVDTIIPKDVMKDLLGEDNFKKMISNHTPRCTYASYASKVFRCIEFDIGRCSNAKEKIFIALKSNDGRRFISILETDDIIPPLKFNF